MPHPEHDPRPRRQLVLDRPAASFLEAFLLGNGWLGASVHGRTGTERIDFNADTLWSGGPDLSSARVADAATMASLRSAIALRDFTLANELGRSLQGDRFCQSYQPVGAIEWEYSSRRRSGPFPGSAAASGPGSGSGSSYGGSYRGTEHYERRLDVGTATATVTYADAGAEITVLSFCSAPAGVFVMHATGDVVPTAPVFTSEHPDVREQLESTGEGTILTAVGRVPAHVLPNYVTDDSPIVYATDEPDGAGLVDAGMGFAIVAMSMADPEGGCRLIVSVETGFRGFDQRPSADTVALAAAARARVEAASHRTTESMLAEHVADYRRLFDRVRLQVAADTGREQDQQRVDREVLYFDFGRYLLISCSRPGTQAANLQGIWNVDRRPGWSCNYTTNINLEMNYWGAERLGLPETVEPLLSFTAELAGRGRRIARGIYGARGAAAHHNSDLWRFADPVPGDPQWSNWPSALLWLSAAVWEHRAFGARDTDDLLDDILTASAEFVLDMLVPDDDGNLVISPSTSPEHSFVSEHGARAAISAGTTMDQELAHEVLTRVVRVSKDAALIGRATAALERLASPGIGSHGQLLEWADERISEEPGHRHLSHLFGVFPGERISAGNEPEVLNAARVALRDRLAAGGGYTGWSQAWVLCLAARLGDRELVGVAIDKLIHELASPSLLDLHPDDSRPEGSLFQIDGNLGATAGIAEALVSGTSAGVALLRALPLDWSSGEVSGLHFPGGSCTRLRWEDHALVEAGILTLNAGPLVVEVPSDALSTFTVEDAAGESVPLLASAERSTRRVRLTWNTRAEGLYLLRRQPHQEDAERPGTRA